MPEVVELESRRVPSIETIRRALGSRTEVRIVPVPADCRDGFTEAFYARPEKFLEDEVRASQSVWGFVDSEVEARFLRELRADLSSGGWDERYGALRSLPAYEGALRLVVGHP
jgi:hypothetical protein